MAARVDNVTDPKLAQGLLLARRGQAYFSRYVQNLTDEEFDGPARLAGWSRRHVVAHVGLNARALTHLTEWAATGVENPMYASPTQRNEDIEFSATLPVQALRNLSDHAAIHLNVEWRDLPVDRWDYPVRTAQGRVVPVSETVWMRTREVWIHAVDLGKGASFEDFPAELLDGLLRDVTVGWARRREAEGLPAFVLEPSDRTETFPVDPAAPDPIVVRGTAARLAQWATGRGDSGVFTDDGQKVSAPRWL